MEESDALRSSFCNAANELAKFYKQSLHSQKHAYICGTRKAFETTLFWLASTKPTQISAIYVFLKERLEEVHHEELEVSSTHSSHSAANSSNHSTTRTDYSKEVRSALPNVSQPAGHHLSADSSAKKAATSPFDTFSEKGQHFPAFTFPLSASPTSVDAHPFSQCNGNNAITNSRRRKGSRDASSSNSSNNDGSSMAAIASCSASSTSSSSTRSNDESIVFMNNGSNFAHDATIKKRHYADIMNEAPIFGDSSVFTKLSVNSSDDTTPTTVSVNSSPDSPVSMSIEDQRSWKKSRHETQMVMDRCQ